MHHSSMQMRECILPVVVPREKLPLSVAPAKSASHCIVSATQAEMRCILFLRLTRFVTPQRPTA